MKVSFIYLITVSGASSAMAAFLQGITPASVKSDHDQLVRATEHAVAVGT